MLVADPPHATESERERAMGELKRLTSLPHEQRVAALRKLPGIGPMADDVARAMGSLPPDALMAMARTLDVDAIGALAGRANGFLRRLNQRFLYSRNQDIPGDALFAFPKLQDS